METIGDLKLKSAKDYIVPKHLRMNPEGKREQLKSLEETVRTHSPTATLAGIISLKKKMEK